MKVAMKKGTIVLLSVVAVLAIILIWGISAYNGLVNAEEAANTALSNIDTRLSERAAKIPNLVDSAKIYIDQENAIYDKITEARAALAASTSMDDKLAADAELSTAVNQLLALMESNPEIKSDKPVLALMDEVSEAENKISTARRDYNSTVQTYNVKLRRFPTSLIAGMFGFEKMELYEAPIEDTTTPDISELYK